MEIFIKEEFEGLLTTIKGFEVENGIGDPICEFFAAIMANVHVRGECDLFVNNHGQDGIRRFRITQIKEGD